MRTMPDLLEPLGRRVRALRQARGLSLRALAARGKVSTRFLGDLEAGRANISVVRLDAVARALDTTAGGLLRDAEPRAGALPGVIALLGIRGAGKSTIGEKLAARLGVAFLELDRLIEAEAGLALADIFALHGEAYYRRLETRVLERLLDDGKPLVLATGGGIVANAPAISLLERRALTVWLRATADDYWERVVRQGDERPIAGNPAARAELRRLVVEREPLYRRAALHVDTGRLGVAQSVETILRELGRGTRATPSRRGRGRDR